MGNLTTSFLHQGSLGDTVASLPAIREYYKKCGKKAVLYLQAGLKAVYYQGAVHPTMADDGVTNVMLNKEGISMMSPLFKAQEYIADCKIWENEPIHINLGMIRETNVGMPNLCLSRWYFQCFPDLACDLSEVWLNVPNTDKDFAKGKIIVTRTERYLNPNINYKFLKKYEKDVIFSGTELEYQIFKLRYDLNIPKLVVKDFLELAQAIKQSKFHVSNQTMAFQISQGLKHPRIVELCEFAPNVIVIGKDAYDFMSQESLEYYVDYLWQTQKTQANGFPVPPEIKLQ